MMNNGCALIVGVGNRNGIGGAVSTLIGRHGLHVVMVGRTDGKLDPLISEIEACGGSAEALTADCTLPGDMQRVFVHLKTLGKPLRFVLYNAGRNIPSAFLKSDVQLLDDHFKRGAYGGLLTGQGALRLMLQQEAIHGHRGSIFYTGASASLRGKPMFAGFSAAKAGLRAMAQSMAREFGPQGIHVGHVVIDGIIDGAIVQELGAGVGKFILSRKGKDGGLQPDEVAKAFWMLHQQPRNCWTHELDLRPYKEAF